MATTSRAMKDLSDQNQVGTRLGASTSDLIGFYGVTTGVVQPNCNTLSYSSGALASTLAFALNQLGLVNCSSMLP